MALQFVFGGSGSGKSHYLYQRIIQEAGEHPALNYMVLVPEQFTMQTQKDLVLMNEKKGIMNIDVLSFGRLAYRIFEETGKGNTPVLDDEGKNLILRKIAGDIEPELRVLKGNMKRLGYISEVKSVLSEFDQYDIGEEEIDEMLDHLDSDNSKDALDIFASRLATMACKAAVKGNNRLSMEEAEKLLDELMTLENPYHCPHGRPTIISMTKTEMEKKFKRIV